MGKAIKWISIILGGLIILIIAVLLIAPMFVDIQKYKPEIEKKVAKATGRSFTIGDDLSLSLFPWAGLSFSDLHFGNLPGFEEKDFITVKSFEVRVKLLPLISRDIQVKRFILEGARIVLEKKKDGHGNWEGLGGPPGKKAPVSPKGKEKPAEAKPAQGLPIKSLAVGKFNISGSALWIDHAKGVRKEISDFSLSLKDVSFDRPVQLALSARLDNKPVSLEGKIGPVGKDPGKGTIPFDIAIKALEQVEMSLKGRITDPAAQQRFDIAFQVSPFSPRKLIAALDQSFTVTTADPEALNKVALKARIKGNPSDVSVSEGSMDLDQSKLKFSVRAKEFSKPDIAFDLNLDQIDLDRYLPPLSEKKPVEEKEEKKEAKPEPGKKKKTDYTPLRSLVLDGTIRVGKLKAKGARVGDIHMKITAKNGLINMDPLTLKLYKGDMGAKGTFDVRKDTPKSNMSFNMQGVQAGPFLQDFMKKDILEGTVKSKIAISMSGDEPEMIKRTLNGKGDLLFEDGAVVGIDLAGMVRNIKATFGLAEKSGEKPRTDFSELHAPFTITNGLVNTPGTSMKSPLLRLLAAGKANLVKETLDFRIEPKLVATIKGQGDSKQRGGITVPILVTGTFSEPKFRPDLKGMFKKKLEEGISDPSKFKKMIKEGDSESLKETGKGLLKGILGK